MNDGADNRSIGADRASTQDGLLSWYGAQRADLGVAFSNGATMVGFALGYVGVVLTIFATATDSGTRIHTLSIGWVQLVAPMPLWALVAYHAQLTLVGSAHSWGARVLEDEIAKTLPIPSFKTAQSTEVSVVGVRLGEVALKPSRKRILLALNLVVAYGGMVLSAMAFSAYMVVQPWSASDGVPWWVAALFAVLYLVLAVASAATYLSASRLGLERPASPEGRID